MAKQQEKQPEIFTIKKAVRHAVPQVMSIYGVTFSGKTFGALMLAAGLVKPGGKVGFIDTENGRGCMYADDPDVRCVLPQGYDVIELDPPFHPERYIWAIRQFEREGYDLVVTDSGSHAWEGEGGALDMKEHDKQWNNAKLWTKRFSTALRYSNMHQIVCLRAQEKTKIIGSGRDTEYISLGILPICEKSFTFDLGLAFSVEGEIDGRPATHLARPTKWPKAMNGLLNNWKPQLLTPEVGRAIQEWNDGAPMADPNERLAKQARSSAEEGIAAYQEFWNAITPAQRLALKGSHAANKAIAEGADKAAKPVNVDRLPEAIECTVGTQVRFQGKMHEVWDDGTTHQWREVA